MQQLMGLLLASVITLGIATTHLPKLAELQQQRFDNGTASQFAEFVRASQRYISDERQAILDGFQAQPDTEPRSLTAAQLTAAGALSSRFVDRNTFGQRHAVIVQSDPNDSSEVEALAVTFGGDAIGRAETARLAQNAGPRAGLVHPDRDTEVWGAHGQWSVTISDFSGGSVDELHVPSEGHLAALLSTDAGSDPAGLEPVGIVPSGEFVDAPDCGARTPEIYVIPVQFSDNGHGYPLIGLQAAATAAADGSGWTVRMFLFREHATLPNTGERISLSATHGQAAVFTWCA